MIREELLAAIKNLRLTQFYNFAPINEAVLKDEKGLAGYFEAEFQSEEAIAYEKAVAAMTVRAVYSTSWIPDRSKEFVARRQVDAVVDALRKVQLDYQFSQKKITNEEYVRRMKGNRVAKTAARLKKLGKHLLFKGTKMGVAALITKIAVVVAGTTVTVPTWIPLLVTYGIITLIDEFVPNEVKEKIKKVATDVVIHCVDTIKTGVEKLKNTTRKLAKKVEEKIETLVEKTEQIIDHVGATIKKGWNKTTAWLKEKLGRK